MWRTGIYLGRTHAGNAHMVADAQGVFHCRTLRRDARGFDVKALEEMMGLPWAGQEGALPAIAKRRKKQVRIPDAIPEGLEDEAASDPPSDEDDDKKDGDKPEDDKKSDDQDHNIAEEGHGGIGSRNFWPRVFRDVVGRAPGRRARG